MIFSVNRILTFIVLSFTLAGSMTLRGASVDWSAFLSKHDLVWEKSPEVWYDAPFLGNGMLGSMFYQVDKRKLRIDLGRVDAEDRQSGTTPFISKSRLPNGYFILETKGEITGFTGRLNLYDAEAIAVIKTTAGEIALKAIVHSDDMVIAYEFTPSGGETAEEIQFVPLKAIAPARLQAEKEVAEKGEKANRTRISWSQAKYQYNPDPVLEDVGSYKVSRQTLAVGGEIGTAWLLRNEGESKLLLVSVEHSYPQATAVDEAVAHLEKVKEESYESFRERHQAWWHQYYPKSFISIEDTLMEGFYWIQVYKFGAGARQGRAYMDTMGPWMVENTAWANGWFNLNTQLSYWFLTTANRMEVAESLFTKMDESLPTLVANMPAKYKGECAGMATICPQDFTSPFPSNKLGFMGELLWTCHDYWLMLERTMDEERITNKFFPLLKKSVNTYIYNMEEGEDGKLHLPHSRSPEYGDGEDCNFNLALFRWGCKTLTHIAERYGVEDELLPKWKDISARLVDYPISENGYMVAKDFPFEQSHRHYSHLMMIYPLCEINIDQAENIELMEKSIDHWINYPGTGNAGYSWSGVAAMYALLGDGEKSAKYLDIFMNMQKLFPDNPAAIHCTTMYTETGRYQPVTETPFSLCDSMQMMLLQSWGDTIRIFPAVPESWQNTCFDGLLAKGGFEISASRKAGATAFIKIKSLAGEPCIIKAEIEVDRIQGIDAKAVQELPDGRLKIDLAKGEEVTLFAPEVNNAEIAPVASKEGQHNFFGLKN